MLIFFSIFFFFFFETDPIPSCLCVARVFASHHYESERFPLVATSLYSMSLCIAMMILNSCNDFTRSKGPINFHRTVWLTRPFQISPMEESIFSNSFHGGIDFIKLFPWTLRHFGKVSTVVFITSRLVSLFSFLIFISYFFFLFFFKE